MYARAPNRQRGVVVHADVAEIRAADASNALAVAARESGFRRELNADPRLAGLLHFLHQEHGRRKLLPVRVALAGVGKVSR